MQNKQNVPKFTFLSDTSSLDLVLFISDFLKFDVFVDLGVCFHACGSFDEPGDL